MWAMSEWLCCPYTLLLHEARGFPGAVQCASAINALIAEGDLKEGRVECKVQDMRSKGRRRHS